MSSKPVTKPTKAKTKSKPAKTVKVIRKSPSKKRKGLSRGKVITIVLSVAAFIYLIYQIYILVSAVD